MKTAAAFLVAVALSGLVVLSLAEAAGYADWGWADIGGWLRARLTVILLGLTALGAFVWWSDWRKRDD